MRHTICLNMIVKNEAHVILRCLASVRPWIDRWTIVDTGSTDGTQDLIREYLHELPGTLHERPWRNFGHNRSEALALAGTAADYLLFIDADETLRVPADFAWTSLGGDAYDLIAEYGGTAYGRCALVSTRLQWRWVGVLHEYLEATPAATIARLEWPRVVVAHDGARARDPSTYARDAALLERALAEDPLNTRYAFYLAQSYRDAGRPAESLAAYRRRAAMAGWDEEVWYSLLQVGVMSERLGLSTSQVSRAYLESWQYRPTRAEPLCELARHHRERREFALGYLYARQAAVIARPSDRLFIDESVYSWRALDELGICAFYAGAIDEGRSAIERLLAEGRLPVGERARIEANLAFYPR